LAATLVALVGLTSSVFVAGGILQEKNAWPMPTLKVYRSKVASYFEKVPSKDQFGRILSFSGKHQIECPGQDASTLVLLVIGQSNSGNHQGQRYDGVNDHVVNYSNGRCYRASSPLLGAEGIEGESWTLLGNMLVNSGKFTNVVIIPAAVGSTDIARWTHGGDLNEMLSGVVSEVSKRYAITDVLWHQGETDFRIGTTKARYQDELTALVSDLHSWGVKSPFYVSQASYEEEYANWMADNPVTQAQVSVLNGKDVLAGPNTDNEISERDRYDGTHFSLTGQIKFANAWFSILTKGSSTASKPSGDAPVQSG
jgi:hypothetical protein